MKSHFVLLSGLLYALSQAPMAPAADGSLTTSPAAASSGVEVGVARRDGVTVSGNEAYVTRHKITEKLVKDLALPSGVTVRPDGTVILADGTRTALQADQLLTLDGRIVQIPRDPRVNPAPPVSSNAQTAVSAAPPIAAVSQATTNLPSAGLPTDGTGDRGTFIGSDGIPFVGMITSPGVITKDTGGTVPIDGSIQTLTPGIPNVPMAKINPDGTVITTAGTIIHPDGTVRTKDGTIISPTAKQGTSVQQDPIPRLKTVAPEETASRQLANPHQAPATNPAGPELRRALPGESAPATNGGTNGAAPTHPGGPAPVGQYGR